MAELRLRSEHLRQRGTQGGRATRAVGGAEVEVGQAPIEEPRQLGFDAVAVEQHDMAVRRAQPFELGLQRGVVRAPAALAARVDLGRIRLVARAVEGVAGEEAGRHQAGVVHTGVHRRVFGWPVQVDNEAREPRHQHARAHLAREGIQLVEMPVGIFDRTRALDLALAQIGRDGAAHVRQADEQRTAPALQCEQGFAHSTRSLPA